MPYARSNIWYVRPRSGRPRLIWQYIEGAYGPLHSMNRRFSGRVYFFWYTSGSSYTKRPFTITLEALQRLKVIP